MKNPFYLFILAFLFNSLYSFAQSKTTVYAKGGITIPIGAYSDGMENNEGGYAKSGSGFGLGVGYDLKHFYRVSLEAQYRTNPASDKKLEELANSIYPGITWKIDAGSYEMTGIMAGFGMYIPETSDMIFGFKAGLGVFNFKTPEFTIRGSVDGTSESLSETSDNATSGAFSLEAEIGYRFGKSHSITFNPDFFIAKPEFKTTNPVDGSSAAYQQEMNSIMLGLRYTYRF